MKKTIISILTLILLLSVLTGCGSKTAEVPEIDLQAFLEDTEQKYELGSITSLDGEMLDAFYPGLRELEPVQLVAYMPMITGRVSEYVFLRCADSADARTAADILRQRAEEQAAGGAWYPESTAAWANAEVLVRGDYALLIAAGDLTADIAADFEVLWKG